MGPRLIYYAIYSGYQCRFVITLKCRLSSEAFTAVFFVFVLSWILWSCWLSGKFSRGAWTVQRIREGRSKRLSTLFMSGTGSPFFFSCLKAAWKQPSDICFRKVKVVKTKYWSTCKDLKLDLIMYTKVWNCYVSLRWMECVIIPFNHHFCLIV